MNPNQSKRSRFQLYAMFMVFVIPMAICLLMYLFPSTFSLKTTQQGILINPPIKSDNLTLNDAAQHKWQIVFMTQSCANEQTDKTMFSLHQLRKALGKDSQRVSLTLLTDTSCQLQDTHDFRKVIFTKEQFKKIPGAMVYLVDPLGNMFMYYPQGSDPMHILQDLKHVLGVSQIG